MEDQMNLDQTVIYSVVLGIIIGFLLRDLVVSFFEKNRDFKVARMEELPEGGYTIFERIPRSIESGRGFQLQEILLIKSLEMGREKGPLMAVFFTTELIEFSKDKGNILSFSVFHKKHSCFVRINFGNSKENITLKKTISAFTFGERWGITSQVLN